MQLLTSAQNYLRKELLFLFFLFPLAVCAEEYVFSKLYDPDFNQINSRDPLCQNLSGRTYSLLFSKDMFGNSVITMSIGEQVPGVYSYEQYADGWYVYKSCIQFAGCSYLYVYKDKSVIRYSGMYDAGYYSEATLAPRKDKRNPNW